MTDDREQDMTPTAAAEPRTGTVSVVVVDDHLLLADAVASGLRTRGRVTVLDVAASCAEGLAAVERHRPDVCLLDQRLPDGFGTDLVPRLLAASPDTKVLLVTADDSVDVLHQALAAGAVGIVNKGQRADALHEAVMRAAEGITILSARDVQRLLPSSERGGQQLGDDLTPRERDVLRLLVQGVSTRDIAARLFISYATARNHIQSVIGKLGAHNKLEAVTIALRENIVSGP
ncbi:response regulator transcription factor [Phycicoccus sp. MAQZ13P-2]|uniref:response regulator n=1 Tax=Phycicoccus mangrovi TaxID=2840470 RepID=UPI001BFFFBFA|nr:response regulator transcription factor [Phycicoccus mangrovi]MBT9254986.1 response regulator transcription factor [Phycicoccus mangrovi]MBT9256017.1 response regulator transcription factor [Phycicoccus mangrovi]MBT9273970.1 response regulator transcription factor [Phycicoccus mangrovi]